MIEEGVFAPQLEAYLNKTFRHSTNENWYGTTRKAEGEDIAEQQLAQWVERGHYNAFASCLEPVARGLLALAKAKEDSLVDITACASRVYTRIPQENPRRKYVLFNFSAPGCGCNQPEGSYRFSPGGELGLKAVVLEMGWGYEELMAELTLVLPAWGTSRFPAKQGELVLVKVNASGRVTADRYTPETVVNGEVKAFTDTFLKHLLGMAPLSNIGGMQSSAGVSQTLGFPGAKDFLVATLPDLGDYFVALAEKLTTPHAH